MLHFTVITLFPRMFDSPLGHSILKRAQEKDLISVRLVDPRNYATDRHRVTDDYPYGGGQGMIMKPEPLVAAIENLRAQAPEAKILMLSPRGRIFTQAEAAALAQQQHVALVCGRYEGVDERVKSFVDDEISVGDFTLSGGEPAAMVVIDAVARLIPGVLGNEQSATDESFSNGLLEYPQYTRPEDFRGMRVPEVLLSGDHERIRQWRRQMSLGLTMNRRPDLLAKATLTPAEKTAACRITAPVYVALLHHPVYDKNGQVVTNLVNEYSGKAAAQEYWPKMGDKPIKLRFGTQDQAPTMSDKMAVWLCTTEPEAGDYSFLSKFTSVDVYYYQQGHGNKQLWIVTKMIPSDGPVLRGEKIYLRNADERSFLAPTGDGYLHTQADPPYAWEVVQPPA